MKQTAVEWLYDRFLYAGYAVNSEWLKQAKEIHKDEIINAYETSHISMMTAEQYYNETFNANDK
jgi:hypothetical protein